MASDVSVQSAVVAAMVKLAEPVRTLVAGTDAMRKAGQTYLPKEPMESVAAYDNRKARSVLFNATGKTVEDMTGKVFAKPITPEKDVADNLKDWIENVDLAGRHLNVFAKDVFLDSMQPGVGYIYVDMPPAVQREDGAPASIADEKAAGLRPYLKFVPLENLLGWKSELVGGVETLTQIRMKECATVQDPENEYVEKAVEQVRVVTRTAAGMTWQTFRKSTATDNKDKWVSHEGPFAIVGPTAIPLVPVYLNRTDFMCGKPPLAKLAELNIAHWQSASDQRNILHVARVPILFGAGFGPEDKLVIGSGEMIVNSNPAASLTYTEHSGAAIGAGDKDLQNLELAMQAMGLQLLIDKPGQSATGEVRDDEKENSPLAMAAGALQDALEGAFGFMVEFAKQDAIKGGSLKVNRDFGITGNTADLQYLTQAAIAGKISQDTYWSELQRRGVLSDSFDAETEAQRVADQAPDLSAGVPPGKGMKLDA